jgi:hypothetical protein
MNFGTTIFNNCQEFTIYFTVFDIIYNSILPSSSSKISANFKTTSLFQTSPQQWQRSTSNYHSVSWSCRQTCTVPKASSNETSRGRRTQKYCTNWECRGIRETIVELNLAYFPLLTATASFFRYHPSMHTIRRPMLCTLPAWSYHTDMRPSSWSEIVLWLTFLEDWPVYSHKYWLHDRLHQMCFDAQRRRIPRMNFDFAFIEFHHTFVVRFTVGAFESVGLSCFDFEQKNC